MPFFQRRQRQHTVPGLDDPPPSPARPDGAAVAREVRHAFPGKVFETMSPRNIRLAEAPSHGKPVAFYDLRSKGAQAYLALAREWVGQETLARREA